jgi:hypothetical protein
MRKVDDRYIRCTRYTTPDDDDVLRDTGWASNSNPMWFHKARPDVHENWEFIDEKYLCGGTPPAERSVEGLSLVREDDYEFVTLDELPDDVCVALAVRALVNEVPEGGVS